MTYEPGDKLYVDAAPFWWCNGRKSNTMMDIVKSQVVTYVSDDHYPGDDNVLVWFNDNDPRSTMFIARQSVAAELRSTIGPLKHLANKIANINTTNGWFDEDRPFSADIALLHSEVSEAYEQYRKNMAPNYRYYDGTKPEGIPSELADIIIRVLDTCHRYDIDIDEVLREKLEHNKSRGYKHNGRIE